MKKEEIHLGDFHRIFIGEVPPVFFIEIIIRTAIIYLILVVSIRLMGKRMSAQLGRNELAAMVSLAAAIGVPLQAPDRGLLPVVLLAGVIITFQQFISVKVFKNQKFEKITQGNIDIIVNNGVMDLTVMENTRITRERLFAELRCNGVAQLGIVKRLYLEANGSFTLLKNPDEQFGLSIIPDWDDDFMENLDSDENLLACKNCGFTRQSTILDKNVRCEHCGLKRWIKAVK